MWKKIRAFKVRRFNVETTYEGVELCGECRLVGNTLTLTVTKPFVGMSTQIHIPYYKSSLRMEKAREMALNELELCFLDFTTVGSDYEVYKDIFFKHRRYLLELEHKRRSLMATAEIVKRDCKERKIDSYEHYRSYRAVKNALKMIDVDGKNHYERMIREHKLTNIGFEYVKCLVLYFLHHEEAKNMFDEHERKQTEIQEWLNSDSNTTWDEWLNLKNGNENNGGG